jgi:hypothetical protein
MSDISCDTSNSKPADFYGSGDFNFISSDLCDGPYYRNAHWAISQCEMWDWMRTFEPHPTNGFMFTIHPNLKIIEKKMYEQQIARGHSGASYGITMRQMSYIAKNGYEQFKQLWLEKNSE